METEQNFLIFQTLQQGFKAMIILLFTAINSNTSSKCKKDLNSTNFILTIWQVADHNNSSLQKLTKTHKVVPRPRCTECVLSRPSVRHSLARSLQRKNREWKCISFEMKVFVTFCFLVCFFFPIFLNRNFRFEQEQEKGANDTRELKTVHLLALVWTTVQGLMQTIIRRRKFSSNMSTFNKLFRNKCEY